MPIAFVTGGSGFLGRNLIPYLRARGWTVRALARSEAAMAAVAQSGAQGVLGDLTGGASVVEGMKGSDVVLHAAAWAKDWGPYAEAFESNVTGTEKMLEAAKAAGVRRFVHVSTEAVLLGGKPMIQAHESWPIPALPLGTYAKTKALAEKRVRDAMANGLDTIIVRPRFIWGKGDTTLLPRLVEAARSGALKWIGGGRYLTSTTHVTNACEGLLCAAERGKPGETYFTTDGSPIPFREMIEKLLMTAGVTPPTGEVPKWIAHVGAQVMDWSWRTFGLKGEPPVSHAAFHLIGEEVTINDAKARREIGYTGSVTREAGLKEMSS